MSIQGKTTFEAVHGQVESSYLFRRETQGEPKVS